MFESLFTLLVFSIVMAVASFAAGMLPLAISLSQSQLRLISAIGMGVLVGTSMIVIIPEGIETLYSHNLATKAAIKSNAVLEPRGLDWGSTQPIPSLSMKGLQMPVRDTVGLEVLLKRDDDDDDDDKGRKHSHKHEPTAHKPEGTTGEGHGKQDHTHGSSSSPHKWVGISLISGFILMYLIEVVPKHAQSSSSQPYHIAIDNLRTLSESPPPDAPTPSNVQTHNSKPHSTTLGLVIHAAADGIALGASSTSSNVALEAIVFLAIMLHKAPAAFGLSAVLLRAGLSKRQARGHLVVFSLAAPAGALVTWALVNMLSRGGTGDGMQWWTGVLLLFSGGTFLYVAMHTMQDQAEQLAESGQKYTVQDTAATVFGMLLPVLTQLGDHHH